MTSIQVRDKLSEEIRGIPNARLLQLSDILYFFRPSWKGRFRKSLMSCALPGLGQTGQITKAFKPS